MIQVNVTKVSTGVVSWGAQFPDQTTANSWISQCQAANVWGKPGRQISSLDPAINSEDISKATGSQAIVLNGVSGTLYTFGPDYSVLSVDVSAQAALEAAIQKGLATQAVGASIVAQVYAYNEANLAAGTLTTQLFNTMLADQGLANIERLLWNGSLATALALIQASQTLPSYFSAPQISAIESAISSCGLI